MPDTAHASPVSAIDSPASATSPSIADSHKAQISAKSSGKPTEKVNVADGAKSAAASHSTSPNPPAPLPTTAQLQLDQYFTREQLHTAAIIDQVQKQRDYVRSKKNQVEYYYGLKREKAQNPTAAFGPGYQGFGNGTTDGRAKIVYARERKRAGNRKAREFHPSSKALKTQAEEGECLVPIRLEIDHDGIKLRDTFTWNLHERTIPLDVFAENLIEDFHLNITVPLVQQIVKQMSEQLTNFYPHIHLTDEPLDPALPYTAYKNDEIRIPIKLNITIGRYVFVDQFEWDLNNPLNSPEEFAQITAAEYCLSGEFTTAIAASIREQCHLYTKYMFQTGHIFDGRPIEDPDLRESILPSPPSSIVRPVQQAKQFEPGLFEISLDDLEKVEKDISRESRRKRRVNRRGGPSLPDLKEMPKVVRTQIVSSILPGAVLKVSDMKLKVDKSKEPESEEDSSDDEVMATPPPTMPTTLSTATGATVTRGRRGAAQSAAAALRATSGRSATPEVSQLQYLSYSSRRGAASQSTLAQSQSLMIVLRLPPAQLRRLASEQQDRERQERRGGREPKRRNAAASRISSTPQPAPLLATTASRAAARSATPATAPKAATPVPAHLTTASAAVTTTLTPGSSSVTPKPAISNVPATAAAAGSTEPPTIPAWLVAGLEALRAQHPNDRFEGIMKRFDVDSVTGEVYNNNNPAPPGHPNVLTTYQARIRCSDCIKKLYTPGPDETVDNFRIHLSNGQHRQNVQRRLAREAAVA